MNLILRALFRLRVEGTEHVPLRGAAILAPNHVSMMDGPALAVIVGRRLGRPTRFLVAAEMFDKFFFGWVLRRFNQIPIRRGEGDADALDDAVDTLRDGALVAVSPEGRVNENPDAGLQRIRTGTARIALPTEAPIIPVAIWGTQRRMPRSGLHFHRPWRPRLGVVFGPPILPAGSADEQQDIGHLTTRLGTAIQEQVERAKELS